MHDEHDRPSTTELQDVQPSSSLLATPTMISPPSTPGSDRHSVDGSSSYLRDAGSDDERKPPAPSVPLERSVYIVFLVLLYGAAALYAWVIICILTHRPIGRNTYTPDGDIYDFLIDPNYEYTLPENLDVFFGRSEKYLRAARVVQAVVSVLTIPLTSAVCSQAAVVYIQKKRGNNHPTLRQSMALGDKGWADIEILRKLFFGGWKKYRSSLLLFALFLHLLGVVIAPVQQIFLSYKTIKRTASEPNQLPEITAIADLLPDYGSSGLNIVKLRSNLASAVSTEVQPGLWSSSNGTVNFDDFKERFRNSWSYSYSALEKKSQNTLANISSITDPFWAELPTDINTGLLRQLAPRINSSATWENNSAAALPPDCHSSSDALYLHYEYDDLIGYNIEICLPGNMSQSPWKNQNSRQDFTEELYLRMNFSGDYDAALSRRDFIKPGLYSRKLTLHTTAGYFELPNYARGQTPGPLIEGDPFNKPPKLDSRNLGNDTAWNILNTTRKAINIRNKGPLHSTTLALFGEGSFVDVQHTALAAYANSDVPFYGCIGLVPLISLLYDSDDFVMSIFEPCLDSDLVQGPDDELYPDSKNITMHAMVAAYFFLFSGTTYSPPSNVVQNAFMAAAFLANDVMMTYYRDPTLEISYSMGADIQIPQISRAGIIFVSILLALDLLLLLALAVYGAWNRRWTGTLDSFAMMRIGASIADQVPLLATRHVDCIKALDETPGWMGNESEHVVGELRLGGKRPLTKTRRYVGYDSDYGAKPTTSENVSAAFRQGLVAVRRELRTYAPGERA